MSQPISFRRENGQVIVTAQLTNGSIKEIAMPQHWALAQSHSNKEISDLIDFEKGTVVQPDAETLERLRTGERP